MAFWFLHKPLIDPFALKIWEYDNIDYSFVLIGKENLCVSFWQTSWVFKKKCLNAL